MTYFAYFGVGVAALATFFMLTVVLLVIVALWQDYGPSFHYRKPETHFVMSVYRGDVRDGEGRRIKRAPDLRIRRIVGLSWRCKFILGLVLLDPDVP